MGKKVHSRRPGVASVKPKAKFDPEGKGYDYLAAKSAGLSADSTGHWPSRNPKTGQILKGRGHETFHLTEKGEKEAGFTISKGKGGKYFSESATSKAERELRVKKAKRRP